MTARSAAASVRPSHSCCRCHRRCRRRSSMPLASTQPLLLAARLACRAFPWTFNCWTGCKLFKQYACWLYLFQPRHSGCGRCAAAGLARAGSSKGPASRASSLHAVCWTSPPPHPNKRQPARCIWAASGLLIPSTGSRCRVVCSTYHPHCHSCSRQLPGADPRDQGTGAGELQVSPAWSRGCCRELHAAEVRSAGLPWVAATPADQRGCHSCHSRSQCIHLHRPIIHCCRKIAATVQGLKRGYPGLDLVVL